MGLEEHTVAVIGAGGVGKWWAKHAAVLRLQKPPLQRMPISGVYYSRRTEDGMHQTGQELERLVRREYPDAELDFFKGFPDYTLMLQAANQEKNRNDKDGKLLVIVASPYGDHLDNLEMILQMQASNAIRVDKLIIEKPICAFGQTEEMKSQVEEAKRRGIKVYVNQQIALAHHYLLASNLDYLKFNYYNSFKDSKVFAANWFCPNRAAFGSIFSAEDLLCNLGPHALAPFADAYLEAESVAVLPEKQMIEANLRLASDKKVILRLGYTEEKRCEFILYTENSRTHLSFDAGEHPETKEFVQRITADIGSRDAKRFGIIITLLEARHYSDYQKRVLYLPEDLVKWTFRRVIADQPAGLVYPVSAFNTMENLGRIYEKIKEQEAVKIL